MKRYFALACIVLLAIAWLATAPASYHEVGERRDIGEPPRELVEADIGDLISEKLVTVATEVPGHDEVLHIPGTNKILVSARDEWIWQVDLTTGEEKKIAYSPVSPTGAKMVPGSGQFVYFCMARLDYNQYQHGPGLYLLDIESGTFEPLLTRVPLTGTMREDGLELPNYDHKDRAKVYTQPLNESLVSELNRSNSRPMQFCNDLDVSRDGKHVYMTEPFSHPRASSGLGAVPEAVTLARNGRVWRYDTESQEVGLVVENSIFADGILIEYDSTGNERSLLLTETVNFLISRAFLAGPQSGEYEILWDNLPGLPDGMDRDTQGRIWVGLIKARSPLITWLHKQPWIKPLILRLPAEWLSGSSGGTGFIVLTEDASEIIAYSFHAGGKVHDLSVVVPVQDKLFLSSFFKDNRGVHYLPLEAIVPLSLPGTSPSGPLQLDAVEDEAR